MGNATVELYEDLGFDRNHMNVRDFESLEKRDAWFAAMPHATYPCSFDKNTFEIRIAQNIGNARMSSYAVLRADTPATTTFYCFVDSVKIVNDDVVSLRLSEDPWQTYLGAFHLRESFVVRKHMDRWSAEKDTPDMAIYPREGIDGFQKVERTTESFSPVVSSSPIAEKAGWMIVAMTTTTGGEDPRAKIAHLASPFDMNNPILAYKYSDGEKTYGFPTPIDAVGGSMFVDMGIDPNTVSFVGITAVAPFAVNDPDISTNVCTITTGDGSEEVPVSIYGKTAFVNIDAIPGFLRWEPMWGYVGAWKDYPFSVPSPKKPTDPGAEDAMKYEPVCYMTPCRSLIYYSAKGSPVWRCPDDLMLKGSFELRCALSVSASGADSLIVADTEVSEEWIGRADALGRVIAVPVQSLDVASNEWLTYVVTERDTTRRLQTINTMENVMSGLTNAVSGSGGNPLSMASGAVGAVSSAVFNEARLEATEQGIRNRSNGAMLTGNGTASLLLGTKTDMFVSTVADDTTMKVFFEKVRRQGYAVNRYMTPDIRSRVWFDYILTSGAVVGGALPEEAKAELASVFDSGVTIWHDDAEMDTDRCNMERKLIA